MKGSRVLSVLLSVLIAVVVLTGSVAVPILCRPYYYLQITPLALEERTGLRREEIVHAYDEMMDFCLGLREDFSAGVLVWSQSGKAHFEDVRLLFLLDLRALCAGLLLLGGTLVFCRRSGMRPHRFAGRSPGFWAAAGLLLLILCVGALAAMDFARAFTVFHTIFFPGKTNWVFDWRRDAVILILPQEFFRNCAVLIGAVLAVLCGALMAFDLAKGRK